jgi:hypothetical protein
MDKLHSKEKTPLLIHPQLTQFSTPNCSRTKFASNKDWLLWLDKILDLQKLHNFSHIEQNGDTLRR